MKMKKYQKCLNIIQPELKNTGDKELQFIIFYFFCNLQLKYLYDLSLIPPEYERAGSISDIEMIRYFIQLSESASYEIIINYIKILREKYIEDNEVIYIMILREEISKYCEALGNYNACVEFKI